jgi:hypothetical protein
LRQEAARTREFVASSTPRTNAKGTELKTNVTDPDSAKMATSKGVIQGYAAQAAVDSAHQIIVAADVIGSGSEQAMLLPMIDQADAYRQAQTLVTADAGYHSDANMAALMERNSHPSERMRRAIDSPHGRRLYSQRIGTVEPVFANLRHNKGLRRLTMRGRAKVNAQWHLYCMVHNIEKLANSGWRA